MDPHDRGILLMPAVVHAALYEVTMFHNRTAVLSVIIILLLSACSRQPTQDPAVGTAAAEAAAKTVAAMVTASLRPTATPTATATPTPTNTPTITPTPTVGPYGPADFPENVNPLTGLAVADPALLDRRPVLLKVTNFPRSARPQAGLSKADIVFEYYIGEGTNRFAALYYGDNAESIGPIRSGRLVDSQLTLMYQAVLGYAGAYFTVNNSLYAALGGRAIAYSDSTCPALCRYGDFTVNGEMANSAEMTKLAQTLGVNTGKPNLDGMAFNQVPPAGGKPAENLTVLYNIYNRGDWHFDASKRQYLRWIESGENSDLEMEPLLDRNTNEQLAFSNVVVLFAAYTEFAPTLHDITLSANTGGQRAVIFRDGQSYEVSWKSIGADKPIQFVNADGTPFEFKHGNTWIAIVGVNSVLSEDDPGTWTAQFYLP